MYDWLTSRGQNTAYFGFGAPFMIYYNSLRHNARILLGLYLDPDIQSTLTFVSYII